MTKTSNPLRFALATLPVLALISSTVSAANNAKTLERVREDIRYLTSEELEGRAPGTEGLQKAAEYIRDEFKQHGLKSGTEDGTYFQPFQLKLDSKIVSDKTSLVITGPDGEKRSLELGTEFQALTAGGTGSAAAEIVFAGYGIAAPEYKYDDFADADVEGKVLLIIRREPQQANEKSAFNGKRVTPYSYIRTKLQQAEKQKVAAVLFVNDPHTTKDGEDKLTPSNGFGSGTSKVPFAHITQELANQLLSASPAESTDGKKLATVKDIEEHIDETFQPMTQPLAGWSAELEFTVEEVNADVANVVGVIEGAGPKADETIVIGAHYDHLGFGPFGSRRPGSMELHPGADDNATGTSAVIELARRLSTREKPPARRIVFVGFSAEERGLIGSNHYITNPLFPLENTVAMINFDMIGMLRNQELTINGARSGKEFTKILEELNDDEHLKLNTTLNLMSGDHFGFYQKSIPCVHFFTGLTSNYHTPDDTFESINVEGVVETIDFCERFLEAVVGLPDRPEYVKVNPGRRGRGGGMSYLGVTPDYAGNDNGVAVTTVNSDSPAEKAGLKPGDVIVKIGDTPITDMQGLVTGLRENRPGQKIEIIVRRGDEEKTLEATLGRPPRGGN